ncbi:MAG TPA: hypothetical protein VGR27_04350, partial [Longimicrobiaceae bacterium]|nr:hypothetical protein [Longimicrobiaceae bacterium]
ILSATYADEPRNGIGPLQAQETIVLRPPFVRAAEIGDVRYIGTAPDTVADGTERLVATAYADGAYLYFGPTDLTGVERVRASLRSLGHPLTLELRAGGPEGKLIASQAIQAPKGRWIEAVVPVRDAGEHDLYLVLRSQAEGLGQWNPLVRADLIRFERAGR